MPQAFLPLVPDGATPLNDRISVVRRDGHCTYFCGVEPVFLHDESDHISFRMFTSQLVCQGACKQIEIVKAFGVTAKSVKRSVKKFREEGIQSFYLPRKPRGATVITDDVIAEAQDLLNRGQSQRGVADVAAEMGVACTRPEERVLAAFGMLQGASTGFEECRDVSFRGVLCALPALTANGLFDHLQKSFPVLGGYYTTRMAIRRRRFLGPTAPW